MRLSSRQISDSLKKLSDYIIKENYLGYDPYDALTSPLFNNRFSRKFRLLRLVTQQIIKNSPVNFRNIIGVRKRVNPVTLGLCVQAFTNMTQIFPQTKGDYLERAKQLVSDLAKLSSTGYSGYCWGYDFDWEGRYTSIPAYTPNIVATGIISNAIFEYYSMTSDDIAAELCTSSAQFVLNDLNKTNFNSSYCYSYSPNDYQVVYNATMKGARLLAQAYAITGKSTFIDNAEHTVKFVVDHQDQNGSWAYSNGDSRKWSDNFHTGYILDCLNEYVKITGSLKYTKCISKGMNFYLDNFFKNNRIPKYYQSSMYPIDTTAAAQSILTLTRYEYFGIAQNVANWTISKMQDKQGYFYYQKHKFYLNKLSYMRWSNAWMLVALSYILMNLKKYDLV